MTLDREVSWDIGQGVSLKYYNESPDIGAYEFYSVPSGTDIDLPDESRVFIVPNPTNGTFKIETGNNGMVKKVLIYNISGKQVNVSYHNEVNISNLDAGIYFVRITSGNGEITVDKAYKY